MHISQTAINVSDALIFLHMFAERTVAQFHVGELVLVLNEKLAAVLTHRDCNVWHYVLEIPLWVAWVEMGVVQNVHMLKPD